MRVCYITHLPNLTGANQSLLDMLVKIKNSNSNIEPYVLLGKHGPLEIELTKIGVPFFIVSYSSEISSHNVVVDFIKRIKSRFSINRIKRIYSKYEIDVVHNNSILSWAGMFAAYKSGLPYVSHIRELYREGHNTSLLHIYSQLKLINNADFVIFISNYLRNKYCDIIHNDNSVTLYDAINVEKYSIQSKKEILTNSTVSLFIAGRIDSQKNQLEAIKAIQILNNSGISNISLHIIGPIGDSSYYQKCVHYVNANKISNVKFLGFQDLYEVRKISDIGIVCSKAEGLGRITIENMLSGCLTIAADAGATPELVSNMKNAITYRLNDANDLASKIVFAIRNKSMARDIALCGLKAMNKLFDSMEYVHCLEFLYGITNTKP